MRAHLIAAVAIAAANVFALPAAPARAEPALAQPTAAERLVLPAPKAGRTRPLVAVVAGRAGAEVTDFIVPYGVLKESGLFDVRALTESGGPVQLFRAIRVQPDQSFAQFDAGAAEGADVVIVPAQIDPKDRALIAWVKAQAAKGATIVSICEGARVLANAGLLEGRRATTHWNALADLEHKFPHVTWVRDRRYVQDGAIISTTGVSASVPASIALIEAVGGPAAAARAAAQAGVSDWSAAHRTADFSLDRADYSSAIGSYLAGWKHETLEIPIADGEDEVALALRADAWMRSFRTKVVITSRGGAPIHSLHGLTILPEGPPRAGAALAPAHPGPAIAQLDATLADMDHRYGPASARLARITLEYGPVAPR